MKKFIVLVTMALTGCASAIQAPPQTITITKTVPVVPPASLYSVTGGCEHGATRNGTVRDMANALIDERAAVDVCLGDRAALRNWADTVGKGQ